MGNQDTPSVNLEGFDHLLFACDDDDIAYLHLDGHRPAVTEEVGDGWYMRVADGAIVGMGPHGFKRVFLSNPFYARVFRPALDEMETLTGQSIDAGSVSAEGSLEQLPRTTHLLLFMMGIALTKYDALRHAEFEDEGRRLLGV